MSIEQEVSQAWSVLGGMRVEFGDGMPELTTPSGWKVRKVLAKVPPILPTPELRDTFNDLGLRVADFHATWHPSQPGTILLSYGTPPTDDERKARGGIVEKPMAMEPGPALYMIPAGTVRRFVGGVEQPYHAFPGESAKKKVLRLERRMRALERARRRP